MLKKTLYLMWMVLLSYGCAEEAVDLPIDPLVSAKTVPLNLTLNIPSYDSPFTTGRTRGGKDTDMGGAVRTLSYSTPEMEVELTATPSAKAETRAIPEGVDNLVYGYHILQFDGTTPSAKLKKKQYVACTGGVISTTGLTLYQQNTTKQRIVVITNLPESYFSSLVVSSSTYSDLQGMAFENNSTVHPHYPLYTDEGKDLMVMCGQTDMVLEEGATNVQASVYLMRTVVKANIDIRVESTDLQSYINWSVLVKNMPNKSFVNLFGGRKAVFPNTEELADKGYGEFLAISWGSYSEISPVTTYLPVNLQPDVPGTTIQERRQNAPAGSTYLEITAFKMSGTTIIESVAQYQINLGLNFTDNYSLPANYNLNYVIRLKGLSPDDSGVIRLVPGKFGGDLAAYNAAGTAVAVSSGEAVKWEYPEEIEIYFQDVVNPVNSASAVKWSPSNSSLTVSGTGTVSMMDGFANTKNLIVLTPENKVPPAWGCFKGVNASTVTSGNYMNTNWYLPAIGQLLGTYIAAASMMPALRSSYWSSTGANGNALSAVTQAYVMTTQGEVKKENINENTHYVRAARNLSSRSR